MAVAILVAVVVVGVAVAIAGVLLVMVTVGVLVAVVVLVVAMLLLLMILLFRLILEHVWSRDLGGVDVQTSAQMDLQCLDFVLHGLAGLVEQAGGLRRVLSRKIKDCGLSPPC